MDNITHDLHECRPAVQIALQEEKVQAAALNEFARLCHKANRKWWLDLDKPCYGCTTEGKTFDVTAQTWVTCQACHELRYARKDRNVGELLMLCVSELAEALEGDRKHLPDDKLPHRSMFEVELADCLIRIFDLAAGKGLDIGGAFAEKMKYNASRADHQIENRLKEGGKAY